MNERSFLVSDEENKRWQFLNAKFHAGALLTVEERKERRQLKTSLDFHYFVKDIRQDFLHKS